MSFATSSVLAKPTGTTPDSSSTPKIKESMYLTTGKDKTEAVAVYQPRDQKGFPKVPSDAEKKNFSAEGQPGKLVDSPFGEKDKKYYAVCMKGKDGKDHYYYMDKSSHDAYLKSSKYLHTTTPPKTSATAKSGLGKLVTGGQKGPSPTEKIKTSVGGGVGMAKSFGVGDMAKYGQPGGDKIDSKGKSTTRVVVVGGVAKVSQAPTKVIVLKKAGDDVPRLIDGKTQGAALVKQMNDSSVNLPDGTYDVSVDWSKRKVEVSEIKP